MNPHSVEAQTAIGSESVNQDIANLRSTLSTTEASGDQSQKTAIESQTRVLKRHLDRLFHLEEMDDYLQFIVDKNPQLKAEVAQLQAEHNEFRGLVNGLIARLDRLEAEDQPRFDAICLEIHD